MTGWPHFRRRTETPPPKKDAINGIFNDWIRDIQAEGTATTGIRPTPQPTIKADTRSDVQRRGSVVQQPSPKNAVQRALTSMAPAGIASDFNPITGAARAGAATREAVNRRQWGIAPLMALSALPGGGRARGAIKKAAGEVGGAKFLTEAPRAARMPGVDFNARDLVDADSYARDYPKAKIQNGYIDAADMPSPKLVEVEDGDALGYDWSEMQRGGNSFPPPTVRRKRDGTLEILDGNHRIHRWTESGNYDHIPARIVDEMPESGPVIRQPRAKKTKPVEVPESMNGYRVEVVKDNEWTGQRDVKVLDPQGNVVSFRSGTSRTDAEILADVGSRQAPTPLPSVGGARQAPKVENPLDALTARHPGARPKRGK